MNANIIVIAVSAILMIHCTMAPSFIFNIDCSNTINRIHGYFRVFNVQYWGQSVLVSDNLPAHRKASLHCSKIKKIFPEADDWQSHNHLGLFVSLITKTHAAAMKVLPLTSVETWIRSLITLYAKYMHSATTKERHIFIGVILVISD